MESKHGQIQHFDKIRFDKVDKSPYLNTSDPDFILVYMKPDSELLILFFYNHMVSGSQSVSGWNPGPRFTNMILTKIPAWISNHMPNKVRDGITNLFRNFNSTTVKVWE